MAKGSSNFGSFLLFGAVSAVLGGIAAYKYRTEIEKTLDSICVEFDANDEDSFTVEAEEGNNVIHVVPSSAGEEENAESDFADCDGEAETASEEAEEEAAEAPAEEKPDAEEPKE